MARMIGRLTALKVDKVKEPGMYADGAGLYLRVTEAGTKNWILRYMLDRRPRWMGLGPANLSACKRLGRRHGTPEGCAMRGSTRSTLDASSGPASGLMRLSL